MLRRKFEKSPWLVFGIIALALIAMGAGVSAFAYWEARNSIAQEKFAALNMAGKVGALTINPTNHSQLKTPRDSFTAEYGNLQQSIASLVSATNSVDRAYTIVKRDNGYYTVLNAEAFESEAREPQLFHPLVSPPEELLESFSSHAHQTSSQPYSDRWGTWYGSFWPILDENGEVQFVLAVDSKAKNFELPMQKLKNVYLAGSIIIFLLSLGVAWIATTLIAPKAASKRNRQPSYIRPISEFLLVLFLVILVGDGLTSLRSRSELDLKHSNLARNLEWLDQIEDLSIKLGNGFQPNHNSIDKLIGSSNIAGWTDISATLESLKFGALPPESTAIELRNRITNVESQLTTDINATSEEMQLQTQSILRTMVLAFFMAVGSLILVRHSSQQERQIGEALDSSSQIQNRYQNVVGNLPIGLFTYFNGEWNYANQEWLRQINAEPGQEKTGSFFNAIHPEDRDETLAILAQAEKERNPFRLEYRLLLNDGNIRHMESRGIPVYASDGSFEQMLGFNVDVTRIVQARIAQQQAFGEIEKKNMLLSSALGELEQALESIVLSFIKAVEAKDPYTAGHSERVMQYSLWLGEAIGLGPYELRILELGTLVHDVGKIGIPDAILTKPDRLTDEEFAVIQKHPEYGEEILKSIGIFRECLPIVRSHHERLNGMGYPDGLKGDQIPMLVRISTIADMFDAMTSNRAYRAGMPIEKVLSIMRECVDKGELDAQLFAVFCQIVKERGIIEQRDKKNTIEAA